MIQIGNLRYNVPIFFFSLFLSQFHHDRDPPKSKIFTLGNEELNSFFSEYDIGRYYLFGRRRELLLSANTTKELRATIKQNVEAPDEDKTVWLVEFNFAKNSKNVYELIIPCNGHTITPKLSFVMKDSDCGQTFVYDKDDLPFFKRKDVDRIILALSMEEAYFGDSSMSINLIRGFVDQEVIASVGNEELGTFFERHNKDYYHLYRNNELFLSASTYRELLKKIQPYGEELSSSREKVFTIRFTKSSRKNFPFDDQFRQFIVIEKE